METKNYFRKIIVTGANKGIGFQIAKQLYEGKNPCHIILTSRNISLGEKALQNIVKKSSNNKIEYSQLDIADSSSIENFVSWVSKTLTSFDVLINNAGFGWQKLTIQDGLDCLRINFSGTVELTEKLLPFLSDDGKVINVTSESGQLSYQGSAIKKIMNTQMDREKLMKIADEYKEMILKSSHTKAQWYDEHYGNTKCLMNAYSRWILPGMLKENQSCYALDPGYCQTDMAPEGPLPVEEGAKTPIFIVNLPYEKNEKLNGKFFINCKVANW